MFGSETLDVAVGLALVFTLTSTICSVVREGIESWFKTRAAFLEYGIRQLLGDRTTDGLAKRLMEHPLIAGLYSGEYLPKPRTTSPNGWSSGNNFPSYIPSRNFAAALLDIAARGPAPTANSPAGEPPPVSLKDIRANVAKIGNTTVRNALFAHIDAAQGDINRARANIEAWYDSAMDRVSGWYRRSTQWMLFWTGLVVAVSLNIDTIAITRHLYAHDSDRSVIVATAGSISATSLTPEAAREQMDRLQLPIGWRIPDAPGASPSLEKTLGQDLQDVWGRYKKHWVTTSVGWILTALAATLGAPFWFDILNKVMVIRSTVKPREKSAEESSKDPHPPAPRRDDVAGAMRASSGADSVETAPHDAADHDTCGVGDIDGTPDEKLPAAQGGVA